MAAADSYQGPQEVTIETDRKCLRKAIETVTTKASAAQDPDETGKYADAALKLCQGLHAIDPSLTPQKGAPAPSGDTASRPPAGAG